MSLEEFRQWMAGMNLYADGAPLEDCQNELQRRGWNAAFRANALDGLSKASLELLGY